jgi:hypothetical protein
MVDDKLVVKVVNETHDKFGVDLIPVDTAALKRRFQVQD